MQSEQDDLLRAARELCASHHVIGFNTVDWQRCYLELAKAAQYNWEFLASDMPKPSPERSVKEWDDIVQELPPLQRRLAELPLDERITVYCSTGQSLTGFTGETDDPRILCLVHAVEFVESEVRDRKAFQKQKAECDNAPLHRVLGVYYIDITCVIGFFRANHPVILCVYTGA